MREGLEDGAKEGTRGYPTILGARGHPVSGTRDYPILGIRGYPRFGI